MKKAFIITVCIMGIAILGLGGLLYFSYTKLNSTSLTLENVYQRSFFELIDNINNIEDDMNKYLVTSDEVSNQKILVDLKQQTSEAQNNLSLLPIGNNTLNTTTKFINQLNGYCTSLLKYGKDSEEQNNETMKKAYSSIFQIKSELNKISNKIMQGYTISSNIDGKLDQDNFTLNFANMSNDSVKYPTMIYDGPFSDALQNRQIKGLENDEISQNEAKNFLLSVFDGVIGIRFIEEGKGKFETYNFEMKTDYDIDYYVQITKQGGFMLNLSARSAGKENEITEENAISIAEKFAQNIGLNNMKNVWYATANGITYVNLAPVVNNVIYYPDLIKAKIDLDSGKLIGWEGTNYAYNHVEREAEFSVSQEEARLKVSEEIKIKNSNLCIIPLEYGGETVAYEFEGTNNGNQYYVYIDANNGSQIKILRVVKTSQGDLLL